MCEEHCPEALSPLPMDDSHHVRLGASVHPSLPGGSMLGSQDPGQPGEHAKCFLQRPLPMRGDGVLVATLDKTKRWNESDI